VSTPLRVPNKIQMNDGMALAAAAVAGGGLTLIDRLLVAHELATGSLVQVLPEYQLRPGQPVYAVYPARPWLALKTSTFVAFLQERLFV
jgi:DNA-binding transcriptional LysR family regulator